ncbi:MAG: response regulator [Anaerolineaceae bacterium]|nr:MAG: response regulator [Anaerolineaceae bacterium]
MQSNILYVEDDAKNVQLIADMLSMVDCSLLTAHDGRTGFEIALQEKPDLIFMDIHLPGVSGIDIIKQFKASPDLQHIPIIAITGDTTEETQKQCFEVGCVDIIHKPVKHFLILDGVRRYTNFTIEERSRDHAQADQQEPKRKKVLIAEDNIDLRQIFAHAFDKSHFEIHVTSDGAEAIVYLQHGLPDVLILDINMPNVSGFEVLRYVRENQRTKDVKVVVVTGNVMAAQAPEADYADLVLIKPVDIGDLVLLSERLTS